jgi:hypothetical protein
MEFISQEDNPGGLLMSTVPSFVTTSQEAIRSPVGGVSGFVDTMLLLCRDNDLQVQWVPEHLRVRAKGQDWHEIETSFPRQSIFRAILASVAAQTRTADLRAISPYGGEGFAMVGAAESPTLLAVKVANTPAEQSLSLEVATFDRNSIPLTSEGHKDPVRPIPLENSVDATLRNHAT